MNGSLIYDWNTQGERRTIEGRRVTLDDETLRDGCQSPTVEQPAPDAQLGLLRLMNKIGIEAADLGYPAASRIAAENVEFLVRAIIDEKMRIRPNCACRTVVEDIIPIAQISQRTGMPIEAAMFLGASPIRQKVEAWSLPHLVKTTQKAVGYAVDNDMPVMFVTEDTTRSDPEVIKAVYTAAIEAGAQAIVLCDTVGYATQRGTYELVRFVIEQVIEPLGKKVRLDWHGHNDRGLGLANAMTAILAGVDQVHVTANGMGERAGNTATEQLLMNFFLEKVGRKYDLRHLVRYCEHAARMTRTKIPPDAPIVGQDVFFTTTGVHAAAILRALEEGDTELVNAVYSGVPAHIIGRLQRIGVGPNSGKANVRAVLMSLGITEVSDEVVKRVLSAAKESRRGLTDAETLAATRGETIL